MKLQKWDGISCSIYRKGNHTLVHGSSSGMCDVWACTINGVSPCCLLVAPHHAAVLQNRGTKSFSKKAEVSVLSRAAHTLTRHKHYVGTCNVAWIEVCISISALWRLNFDEMDLIVLYGAVEHWMPMVIMYWHRLISIYIIT